MVRLEKQQCFLSGKWILGVCVCLHVCMCLFVCLCMVCVCVCRVCVCARVYVFFCSFVLLLYSLTPLAYASGRQLGYLLFGVTAWTSVCSLMPNKIDLGEKLLLHWLQWNGFSPVCVLWCCTRFDFCEKLSLHWLHWNGFSPVCVLCWFKRLELHEKLLLHWLHWNGLSPVCFL